MIGESMWIAPEIEETVFTLTVVEGVCMLHLKKCRVTGNDTND